MSSQQAGTLNRSAVSLDFLWLAEYKVTMKRTVKRTSRYAARALEAVNTVITNSAHSAGSWAACQVSATEEV